MGLIVDVSQFNGTIDFKSLAAEGVVGCYVQAQRGNDGPNPSFAQQVAAARTAGLAVGAYLFAYPLPDAPGHQDRDPVGQADLFWQASGGLGSTPGDLPPMLDCEWPVESCWAPWGVTPETIAEWVGACLNALDGRFNRTTGVYTGRAWWKALGASGATLANVELRPLWLAEYPILGPMTEPPAIPPAAPAPWAKATLWQFTNRFLGQNLDGTTFLGEDVAWRAFLTK